MQTPPRQRPVVVVLLSADSYTLFTQELPTNGKWLFSGACGESDTQLNRWTRKFITDHQIQVTAEKTVTKRTSTPKAYIFLRVASAPKGMKAWATIDFLATLSPEDNLATRIIAQVPAACVPDKFKMGSTPICVDPTETKPPPQSGEEVLEAEFEED